MRLATSAVALALVALTVAAKPAVMNAAWYTDSPAQGGTQVLTGVPGANGRNGTLLIAAVLQSTSSAIAGVDVSTGVPVLQSLLNENVMSAEPVVVASQRWGAFPNDAFLHQVLAVGPGGNQTWAWTTPAERWNYVVAVAIGDEEDPQQLRMAVITGAELYLIQGGKTVSNITGTWITGNYLNAGVAIQRGVVAAIEHVYQNGNPVASNLVGVSMSGSILWRVRVSDHGLPLIQLSGAGGTFVVFTYEVALQVSTSGQVLANVTVDANANMIMDAKAGPRGTLFVATHPTPNFRRAVLSVSPGDRRKAIRTALRGMRAEDRSQFVSLLTAYRAGRQVWQQTMSGVMSGIALDAHAEATVAACGENGCSPVYDAANGNPIAIVTPYDTVCWPAVILDGYFVAYSDPDQLQSLTAYPIPSKTDGSA